MSRRRAGVDELLEDWRDWPLALTGRPEVLAGVPGGRTNRSYRLRGPGLDHDLLVRIHHPESARLGIDRERERDIVTETARAGLGRPFLHWDARHRFAVFPWLEARAWTADDLADAGQRSRLWPMLERLHGLVLAQTRRRYADYLDGYWQRLETIGRIDTDLLEAWQAFRPRLRAFDEGAWKACPVHHDLVPENILDCGDRLVLIDWEYAELGHPDIDRWSIDPGRVSEPFIVELMGWINGLWERLRRIDGSAAAHR